MQPRPERYAHSVQPASQCGKAKAADILSGPCTPSLPLRTSQAWHLATEQSQTPLGMPRDLLYGNPWMRAQGREATPCTSGIGSRVADGHPHSLLYTSPLETYVSFKGTIVIPFGECASGNDVSATLPVGDDAGEELGTKPT